MSQDSKMELASKIIDAEWEMFTVVPNIGGKAPCQQDRQAFKANRMSQSLAWSSETLKSYLADLQAAKKTGRNLLTEKYGYMMKSTSPQEYSLIEQSLPVIDPKVSELVEEIIKVELTCQERIQKKYPNLLKRGRSLYSCQDNHFNTSFETYLRGELLTYSIKTLLLYRENLLKMEHENINGAEISLEYSVKTYGYNTAKEADEKIPIT
jgi:hypothetical protein